VFLASLLFLLAIAPVHAAPSLSVGSTASYGLNGRITVTQSCTSDPLDFAAQACTGAVPPPNPAVLGQPFFNDDFNYANITEMQSAGWQLNGAVSSSWYGFSNVTVTLQDDGNQGGSATWSKIPPNLANWSVSMRANWVAGIPPDTVGDIPLNLITKGHTYIWQVDGFYGNYALSRYYPGQPCCNAVVTVPGYVKQLNVFHILRVDMLNNVITAYVDGIPLATYVEPDLTFGGTDLTSVAIGGAWETDTSYDWITASLVTAAPTTPPPPPTPTSVQVNLNGNVGWTVEGLSSTQAILNVTHNVAVSVSPVPLLVFTPVTESGNFEQSINLSTRVESPGTASQAVMNVVSSLLPALSGLASQTGASGPTYQSILPIRPTDPSYTEWWVNGPLSSGSPVQILDGWSSVTGSETLDLGGSLGSRQAWIVTSQLSQTVNLNIPNVNTPLGPASTSSGTASLKLLWSFDKASDLLLRNNDTLNLNIRSVSQTTVYPSACSASGCGAPMSVSVTRDVVVTAILALQLSSTSLTLPGQAAHSTQGASLDASRWMPWTIIGVVGIASGLATGLLVWITKRTKVAAVLSPVPMGNTPASPGNPS
jgi:hypothetical protein